MNTTTESARHPGIRAEEVDAETERIILERLASLEEDAKTAVDSREALTNIRQNLNRVLSR